MTPITLDEHRHIHGLMRDSSVQIAELNRSKGVLTIEPKSYTLPSS